MNTEITSPTPEPSLRQVLDFMGIEHSAARARRSYLERVARDRAANDDAATIPGIRVTYLDPEHWADAVDCRRR